MLVLQRLANSVKASDRAAVEKVQSVFVCMHMLFRVNWTNLKQLLVILWGCLKGLLEPFDDVCILKKISFNMPALAMNRMPSVKLNKQT